MIKKRRSLKGILDKRDFNYGKWNPDEIEEYRVNCKRIELEGMQRRFEAFCEANKSIPKISLPGEFLRSQNILA